MSSEQTEPPCGTVKAPFPRHLYKDHYLFLKAIFSASIINGYGYYDGTSIHASYYHWRDLVENGQWDWTENQPGHEDTDPSSMPPNDTLKFPCSRDIYELYVPFLEGFLEVRAINGFCYDDDEGGNICVDYYHWSELATWGPWDHIRDQMLAMEPEYAMESEAGRRYVASLQKASGGDDTKADLGGVS
jgi:hypothetical protein